MIRWLSQSLFLISVILGSAAENKSPVHQVDGSFVREWLVLGPFSSRTLETDFLRTAGGEANIRAEEGDRLERDDGTTIHWTRARSEFDYLNLETLYPGQSHAIAYAYCELEVDRPFTSAIRLPYPYAACWINGEAVDGAGGHEDGPTNIPRSAAIDLKEGRNRCLIKLLVDNFEWKFCFQPLPLESARVELAVSLPSGAPAGGARIEFYDSGQRTWFARADGAGSATFGLYPIAERYDLRVTVGTFGLWHNDLQLAPGETNKIDLILNEASLVSGRVVALDESPQSNIVVQAFGAPDSSESSGLGESETALQSPEEMIGSEGVSDPLAGTAPTMVFPLLAVPPFSESVLSQADGTFQFVNLKPGTYRLRCQGAHGYVSPEGAPTDSEITLVDGIPQNEGEVRFVFPEAKKGHWRTIPVHNGLIEVSPSTLHRGSDGLLWVGAGDGTLHAYDGVEFVRTIQTPGGVVTSLAHDKTGNLWVGSNGGLGWLAPGLGGGLNISPNVGRTSINGMGVPRDGSPIIASYDGLFAPNGESVDLLSLTERLPSKVLFGLTEAEDGSLWIGAGIGLVHVKQNGTVLHSHIQGFDNLIVRAVHEDQRGNIWWSCLHAGLGGVYRYDGKTITHIGVESGLPGARVFDIGETSDGDLWFATDGGLARFNGSTLLNYTPEDGLSHMVVQDISVDSDDVLWLSTIAGVSRFDPNGFVSFDRSDGLVRDQKSTAAVFAIEPDMEGRFWVGTEWSGLFRAESGHEPRLLRYDSPLGYVRRIRQLGGGALLLAGHNGVSQLSDESISEVVSRDWVLAINGDLEGKIWMGFGWRGGGLATFDPVTREENFLTASHGLPDDQVWAFERNVSGGMWVGTGNGVALVKDNEIQTTGEVPLLPGAAVFRLRSDRENGLWIASNRGLYHWKNGELNSLTSTNGLPADHVWDCASSSDGTIWIGSAAYGLIGYDGRAVTRIDERDGLQGNSVFTMAIEDDDSLWLGFQDGGVTRYRRSQSIPNIRMLSASFGDQFVTNFSERATTRIGDRITVQFQEVDLKTHPEKRQFHFQLSSDSGEILQTGVTQERSFEWVPTMGGAYRFEVQAIDRDLNYSHPASFIVHAFVPWHDNPWVLVPGWTAIGLLLFWGIHARHSYTLKRREADRMEERARIARDLHDQLGAGLTHVAMLGGILSKNEDQSEVNRSVAATLSQSALELSRTVGQVIWSADPTQDTIRGFVSYVQNYGEKFFEGNPIRLRFDFPDHLPETQFPAGSRHELFMVVKEALNNVAKHSKASEVRIVIRWSENELKFVVEDNGEGFSRQKVNPECRGISNMEKRVNDLGGSFRLISGNAGTQIEVRVNFGAKGD